MGGRKTVPRDYGARPEWEDGDTRESVFKEVVELYARGDAIAEEIRQGLGHIEDLKVEFGYVLRWAQKVEEMLIRHEVEARKAAKRPRSVGRSGR